MVGSCLPPDLMSGVDTGVVNVAARRITGLDSSVRLESLHFLASTSSCQNLYILHCAEIVDAVLRAQGSSAKNRLEQEIGAMLGTQGERITTKEEQLRLPEGPPTGAGDAGGERCTTNWTVQTYRQKPMWENVLEIPSMVTCHADEIQRSVLLRMEVYQYREAASWLDIGVQVLRHVRWSPECTVAHRRNIKKDLPPVLKQGRIKIRCWGKGTGGGARAEENEESKRSKNRKLVTVDTMAAQLDRVGVTVSILRYEHRPQSRKIAVHGTVITDHTPAYLEEVAVLQSLELLREWTAKQDERTIREIGPVEVYAGNSDVMRALDSWLQKGDLLLQTAAASDVVDAITGLETWWRGGLTLMPFTLPPEKRPDEMPYMTRDLFRALEEFRLAGGEALGGQGADRLARGPLSKEAVKKTL